MLDEPMNGLDPDGIRDMRELICDLPLRSGVTVFLSSHLLSEVQQTATHIGLMDQGRLVLQGALADLLAQAGSRLFVRAAGCEPWLRANGYAPQAEGKGWLVRLDHEEQAAALNRSLLAAGFDVVELSLRQPTLESLYLQNSHKDAA
jgi:ABC-2 type transport system ATP-binding protein